MTRPEREREQKHINSLQHLIFHFLFSFPCLHFRPVSRFRVHCFHYLIPLTKQGNYAIVANVESMDYDPLVVKLNKDISAIEEAMGAALQQHKFQYIFEGQQGPGVKYKQLPKKDRLPTFLKAKVHVFHLDSQSLSI